MFLPKMFFRLFNENGCFLGIISKHNRWHTLFWGRTGGTDLRDRCWSLVLLRPTEIWKSFEINA